MELRSFQPSGYLENGTELNMTEVPFDPTSIQWYEEIPLSEAKLILERAMYPFKKVGSFLLFSGHCQSFLLSNVSSVAVHHGILTLQPLLALVYTLCVNCY